jgi:TRAP-type mannitol/chloroaromatic compound transport system substrate-binding protein
MWGCFILSCFAHKTTIKILRKSTLHKTSEVNYMKENLNRRKFLKGSAVAATATAAGTLAAPAIVKADTINLKMQAAWGGGIFLENANSYVKRVNEMAGGALQIELLPVNSVVKTSQMQDAVHRGVLDGAHYVPAYWYSKSPAQPDACPTAGLV